MMMNEFGVPANEHEMMMMKPHEKMMAESGIQNNIDLGGIIDRVFGPDPSKLNKKALSIIKKNLI